MGEGYGRGVAVKLLTDISQPGGPHKGDRRIVETGASNKVWRSLASDWFSWLSAYETQQNQLEWLDAKKKEYIAKSSTVVEGSGVLSAVAPTVETSAVSASGVATAVETGALGASGVAIVDETGAVDDTEVVTEATKVGTDAIDNAGKTANTDEAPAPTSL